MTCRQPGTPMDIGKRLRSLGLERYEAAFQENEITEKVLPNLTAAEDPSLTETVTLPRRLCRSFVCAVQY